MTDPAFPDHDYLTVRELADLLRLKERKVYDLAASGAVPCSRATGKLLFPADEIRAWIARAQSGGGPTGGTVAADAARPAILLGSQDPLLDWAVRQSRCGLATFHDGSMDGLDRFVRGEGMIAGLHIHDAATGQWNIPAVSEAASHLNAVLISFADRRRGLVFRPGTDAPRGLADLEGTRIVPRQAESGTDRLFREMAAQDGLDLGRLELAEIARTEDDAVEAVRRGEGDVAFGLESVAVRHGLRFQPVVTERFALLLDRRAWFEPQIRDLAAFCQSGRLAARAESCGGYDVTSFGTVLWNA
ncbi:MAG: helix-turn-helix transcriptional regulator [Roseovarius sp.]